MFLLTNGNRKLGKEIYGFNLPLLSCKDYSTPLCQKYCYTRHSGFQYPKVKRSMNRNMNETVKDIFIANIVAQIVLERIPYIRLHSSGDFFSQEYFDKWCHIAEMCPNTKFLAFTRNYDIDLNKAPDNLSILYSIDDSTKKLNPTAKHFSYVVKTDKVFKHMEKHEKGFVCASKCYECRACWNGTKLPNFNVVFKQH